MEALLDYPAGCGMRDSDNKQKFSNNQSPIDTNDKDEKTACADSALTYASKLSIMLSDLLRTGMQNR